MFVLSVIRFGVNLLLHTCTMYMVDITFGIFFITPLVIIIFDANILLHLQCLLHTNEAVFAYAIHLIWQ